MPQDLDRPVATADLVEYQPAAVVSRTLIKEPGGTVTLFAFDAGEALSEHTAPFDVLLEVVDGAAEVEIDGRKHDVSAHQAIRLPAHVPHAVRARERFKMLLVMIRAPKD